MGANSRRLVSVAIAVTLSGTPAVLAACALLCAPGTTHAAGGHLTPAGSPHTSCCAPDREAPPAGHAHHGTYDAAARLSAAAVFAPGDASQVAGADASCCLDSQTASLAATATGRADGGLLVAPPLVVAAAVESHASASLARVGMPHRPLRSPAQTPIVLRI